MTEEIEQIEQIEGIEVKDALNFIGGITRAMNQYEEPDQALDQILSACIESTGADSGSIMLLSPDKRFLEIKAARGLSAQALSLRLSIGEGITGWVARYGKPRRVGDSREEKDYISLLEELLSELAVPMIVREELIGVLSVDSSKTNAFNQEHERFLGIMSNLAARIFVNLRDNRQLKYRDRFHRVLIDISKIISQSLQLEDVFREMMKITEKAFRLFRSSLMLYNPQDDVLKIVASMGLSKDEIKNITYKPGEGITGSVFVNKQPEFIPSISKEPTFLNRMKLAEEDSRDVGFFCCPIFSGTDVVGVFSAFTRHQSGPAPESLLEFLEIMGSIISQAVTIQNLIRDEKRVVEFENIQLKRQLSSRYKFDNLIGRAPSMLKLLDRVGIVADSRASVLITGESGTGKELIASAIHYNSPRREKPFVKINCAAIPESLLESELFGHRKGAFTGAVADKKGKFEIADTGTIFLDEIGEMDLNSQSKLLRVLQEREIEPVGGRARQVNIRVIAATNADLEEKIAQKKFRDDLYYRLNVINLKIPSLRERKEDILILAHHFLEKYAGENEKQIRGISPEAMQLMEQYDWPGNVRQLENIIERASVLCRNDILDLEDFQDSTLPFQDRPRREIAPGGEKKMNSGETPWTPARLPEEDALGEHEGRVYDFVISEVEKRLILMALKKFRYTKTKAARYLGINRNTLDKKIRDLRIEY